MKKSNIKIDRINRTKMLSNIRQNELKEIIFSRANKLDELTYEITINFDKTIVSQKYRKNYNINNNDIKNFCNSQFKKGSDFKVTIHNNKCHIYFKADSLYNNMKDLKIDVVLLNLLLIYKDNDKKGGTTDGQAHNLVKEIHKKKPNFERIDSPILRKDYYSYVIQCRKFLEEQELIIPLKYNSKVKFFLTDKGKEFLDKKESFLHDIIPAHLTSCLLNSGEYKINRINLDAYKYIKSKVNHMNSERIIYLYDRLIDVHNNTKIHEELEYIHEIMIKIKNKWNLFGLINGKPFKWPTTFVNYSFNNKNINIDFPNDGVLAHLGYRVGKSSNLNYQQRTKILDDLFESSLETNIKHPAMVDWHEPRSAIRLKKMANTIAAFTRNAKRRKSYDMEVAISEWEADLRYLYKKYYLNKFNFGWPDIK